MFDPDDVVIFDGMPYEGCFPRDYAKNGGQQEGPFVLKSAYDHLLVLYREAEAGRKAFAKGLMRLSPESPIRRDAQTP